MCKHIAGMLQLAYAPGIVEALYCLQSASRRAVCLLQGAFSVAVKAKVPVVPITLIGTGALMPNGQEGKLYAGEGVRIVVHPPVILRQISQSVVDCPKINHRG